RECVSLDVAYKRCILAQAIHDVIDMLLIQFEQAALYQIPWHILLIDPDILTAAAAGLDNEFHIAVYQVLVVGMLFQTALVVDVLFYQFSVLFYLIHPQSSPPPARALWLCGERGIDRLSIAPFTFFLISIIRVENSSVCTSTRQKS